MVPVTDVRGRGEVGSEQILWEVLPGICEWHYLARGRTSCLHPEGVLAVLGHLWLIHEEIIEVDCVNVISQGKLID